MKMRVLTQTPRHWYVQVNPRRESKKNAIKMAAERHVTNMTAGVWQVV
jgi:hypothetical protein